MRSGDVAGALRTLMTRPGELARRLDHLLRRDPAQTANTLDTFRAIASGVSTPVLLQVLGHFDHRSIAQPVRPVFPKGNAAKVIASQDSALQLRYLQTLSDIGVESNSTIIVTDIAGMLSRVQGAFTVLPPPGQETSEGDKAKQ